MNATTTILVTREQRLNLLISAIEGGSNYWYSFEKEACAMIEKVAPSSNKTTFVDRLFKALESGLSIPVHEIEEGEKLGEISLKSIEEGEQIMLKKHAPHFADILSEQDDAVTADVWFQLAVMKDLVYG